MSKEVLLKKAYDEATVNDVVRRGDKEVSFSIIKNAMTEYGKKNKVDFSADEIDGYINEQFAELEKITSDFTIQTKMMN